MAGARIPTSDAKTHDFHLKRPAPRASAFFICGAPHPNSAAATLRLLDTGSSRSYTSPKVEPNYFPEAKHAAKRSSP
jgi:hypothetical protein